MRTPEELGEAMGDIIADGLLDLLRLEREKELAACLAIVAEAGRLARERQSNRDLLVSERIAAGYEALMANEIQLGLLARRSLPEVSDTTPLSRDC